VADAFVADRVPRAGAPATLMPRTDQEIGFHTQMPKELSSRILRGALASESARCRGPARGTCRRELHPLARGPSAEENDHLFLPPEGSCVCVALQDGVLPPELIVFTNIGSCIVVTRVEAQSLPVEARDKEPSWSCGDSCSLLLKSV